MLILLRLILFIGCFSIINSFGLSDFIRFKRISNLFSNANDFISITSNFENFKTVLPGKNNISNFRTENPVEIINSIGVNGDTWIYSKFIEKIKDKEIDAIALSKNVNFANVIDLDHELKIYPENIHHVKIIPANIDYLIDLLINHNINIEVY